MSHKETDPLLHPNQNPKILTSTQTHTTKINHHENKRRDKILTLQKTEAKLSDLPVTLATGKHEDRLMATLKGNSRKNAH